MWFGEVVWYLGKFQGGRLLGSPHCWDTVLCRVALAVDSERIGDTYKATELSGRTERQKFLALIFCLFERKAKKEVYIYKLTLSPILKVISSPKIASPFLSEPFLGR